MAINTNITPDSAVCSNCGETYDYRANKRFCSRACKEQHHKHRIRRISKKEGSGLPTDKRNGMERRATQEYIYERVFSTKPEFRADVLMGFLVFASTTREKRYLDLMTYPNAQRSNRYTAAMKGTAGLHFRGRPFAYPVTLASMANHICKFQLGINSRQFIDEIERDKVTLDQMRSAYDELMDTTKPEPVIKGCDIEEPAYPNGSSELTPEHLAHAEMVLSNPFKAARMAAKFSKLLT